MIAHWCQAATHLEMATLHILSVEFVALFKLSFCARIGQTTYRLIFTLEMRTCTLLYNAKRLHCSRVVM